MGYRRQRIKEEYIISKQTTNNALYCRNCPCRIYNNFGVIRYGKGNLYADNLIILPPYQTEDLVTRPVEEELINEILSLANIPIEDCYFTRAIKCYTKIKGIRYNAAYHCFNTIAKEILFIKPKRIICFGNEVRVYYNWFREKLNYTGKIIILPTFMIKFYDEVSYNNIVKDLIKEYNDKDLVL